MTLKIKPIEDFIRYFHSNTLYIYKPQRSKTQFCSRQATTTMSYQINNLPPLTYCCKEKCCKIPALYYSWEQNFF